jgi:hypothetical protein
MEDKMKKSLFLSALLFALVFAFNGVAIAGSGKNYRELQDIKVFFNNSGKTLSAGEVVVLDTVGTGVTAATTLGAYVRVHTGADSVLVVGVVPEMITSAIDQSPVPIVVRGPVDTLCQDSTDAVTIDTAVGTSFAGGAVAGACGGGTNLGVALETGEGTNSDTIMIWVAPTGAD